MSKQKPNAVCGCGSGKKFKKCCAVSLQMAEPAAPAAQQKMAGSDPASLQLAQKKAFIAKQLGLDPSLDLAELMSLASKKVGVANTASHVSKAEISAADRLIASQPHAGEPSSNATKRAAGSIRADRQATSTCQSCGETVQQVCSVNGCCARCLYEIGHFDRLGQSAVSKRDEAELARAGGAEASTYGEATRLGFRRVCKRLGLSADDTFIDCGSGTGRLVIQAANEFGVRRAIGVELSRQRHSMALGLLTSSSGRGAKPRTAFYCEDFAASHLWTAAAAISPGGSSAAAEGGEADGALVGATVVFTYCIMFDESLMARLARCIEACPTVRSPARLEPAEPEARPPPRPAHTCMRLASFGQVRLVASFRRFPEAHGGLRGFVECVPRTSKSRLSRVVGRLARARACDASWPGLAPPLACTATTLAELGSLSSAR